MLRTMWKEDCLLFLFCFLFVFESSLSISVCYCCCCFFDLLSRARKLTTTLCTTCS
jgi:hypothetical protein